MPCGSFNDKGHSAQFLGSVFGASQLGQTQGGWRQLRVPQLTGQTELVTDPETPGQPVAQHCLFACVHVCVCICMHTHVWCAC